MDGWMDGWRSTFASHRFDRSELVCRFSLPASLGKSSCQIRLPHYPLGVQSLYSLVPSFQH